MGKNNATIHRFQEYLARTGGERHPIEGHMMAEASDYQKNLYLKCLCMMAQFGSEVSKEQIHLLQRLLKGIQGSETLESYMRQGLEAVDATFAELTETALDAPMKRQFFFDAMLVNQIAPPEADTVAFLGSLAEGLGIKQDELVYMVEICRALLKMSGELESIQPPIHMNVIPFMPYFNSCEITVAYETAKELIVSYYKESEIDFEKIWGLYHRKKTMYLRNVIINNTKESLYFDGELLYCINCTITLSKGSINLELHESAIFQKCRFKDFNNYVFDINNPTMGSSSNSPMVGPTFNDCVFANCNPFEASNMGCGWKTQGQLFYRCYCINPVSFIKCEFNHCGGKYRGSTYYSCFIGGEKKCIVSNCKFVDCWHRHGWDDIIDPDDSRRTLFSKSTINDNNTIINSANFN